MWDEELLIPILIGVICLLLIVLGISLIVKYIKKIRKNKNNESIHNKAIMNNNPINYNTNSNDNNVLQEKLKQTINKYENMQNELNLIYSKQIDKLADISKMNPDQAKMLLLNNLELTLKKEKSQLINHYNEITKEEISLRVQNMLINCFESLNEDFVVPKTSFTIKLEDDAVKGRIIGKDGRNKKAFELVTGTELIIEKDPEITISCFNPIRREIAKNVLVKLIENKHIEPSRIEKYFEQESLIIENKINDIGCNVVENQLQMYDINKELYNYVGKLYFRTSYGQNILLHSKECAMLAVSIAREIGVDTEKAKRAAFFHDIGKSVDFDIDNDHVESGVKLARKYNLDDYIINAIESHHEKVPIDNIYSAIVKVVDRISASRPGARIISFEEYIQRVTEIETICNSFEGVKTSYALKAGKQVRVIIDPKIIDDDQAIILAQEIKNKLEDTPIINKQPIDVVLIREKRIEIKSDGSAARLIK